MDQGSIELTKAIYALNIELLNHWLEYTVFTWRWWFGIFFTIAPWILWIFLRKRKSTNRLLFAGLVAMLFASLLDFVGVSFNLWYYGFKILPVYPAYIPWDLALIPVLILLLLQFKPNSYLYIKALFFASFSAFIAEPFFHWAKLYFPIHWSYIYSFPLYFMLFLFCNFLSRRTNFEAL